MGGDDKPADVDAAEFPPEDALTAIDSAPFVQAIDDAAPPLEVVDGETTPHPLQDSAEFRAGLEVGRAEGEKAGYARGVEDGRADIKAEDERVGYDRAFEDLRRYLIADGAEATTALLVMGRIREWARKFPVR